MIDPPFGENTSGWKRGANERRDDGEERVKE